MPYPAKIIPYTAAAGGLPYIELKAAKCARYKNKRWHWALRQADGRLLACDGMADGFITAGACWRSLKCASHILANADNIPSDTPGCNTDMMVINDLSYPVLRIIRTDVIIKAR